MDLNRLDNVACVGGILTGVAGAGAGDIAGLVSTACSALCALWGLVRLAVKLWQAFRKKRLAKTLDEIAENLEKQEDGKDDRLQ